MSIEIRQNEIPMLCSYSSEEMKFDIIQHPMKVGSNIKSSFWDPELWKNGGFHGLAFGEGKLEFFPNKGSFLWALVAVDITMGISYWPNEKEKSICKFQQGRILYIGNRKEVISILEKYVPTNTKMVFSVQNPSYELTRNNDFQIAGDKSTQDAYEYATQIAGHNSTQSAGFKSKQEAGNESYQKSDRESRQIAGWKSNQRSYDKSFQKADCESMQYAGEDAEQISSSQSAQIAGNNSIQKTGTRSSQIARWHSKQEADNISMQSADMWAVQTVGNYSIQKSEDHSIQKAGNNSTQITGNESYQCAGINSVQVSRWNTNNECNTVSRVINADMANKWYFVKDGEWTEKEPSEIKE